MKLFEAIRPFLNEEQQAEAQQFLVDYKNLDANDFIKKHKWLLKYWDIEDFIEYHDELSDNELFVYYLYAIKFAIAIDWSGEEYPGQIKRFLHTRLKNNGYPYVRLNDRTEKEKLKNNLVQRGEWVPLLLNCFDKQLMEIGLKIANISFGHDEYNIVVVTNDWFVKMEGTIEDNYWEIYDTSVWELYVLQIGEKRTATLNLLRKKFSLPLSEIKDFASVLPICLGKGSKRQLLELKDEYEQIDCVMQLKKYE